MSFEIDSGLPPSKCICCYSDWQVKVGFSCQGCDLKRGLGVQATVRLRFQNRVPSKVLGSQIGVAGEG